MSPDDVSERVVDQRCRNRIMEALELVALGPEGVRAVGDAEWVNVFYDWVDDQQHWRVNSSLTPSEIEGIARVQGCMEELLTHVGDLDTDDLIASGWPGRIAPSAQAVLDALSARGVFDEESAETTPSRGPYRPG